MSRLVVLTTGSLVNIYLYLYSAAFDVVVVRRPIEQKHQANLQVCQSTSRNTPLPLRDALGLRPLMRSYGFTG